MLVRLVATALRGGGGRNRQAAEALGGGDRGQGERM